MQPLLIVSLEDRTELITAAIARFLHPSAAQFLKVLPVVSPDFGSRIMDLTRMIDQAACEVREVTGSDNCLIVIDSEVKCNKRVLEGYFEVEKRPYRALVNSAFQHNTKPYLLKILDRQGLSRSACGKDLAKSWSHARLTDRLITSWLDQFAKIGYPWIGEAFLCLLDVITPGEIGDLLHSTLKLGASDHVHLVKDPTVPGKSGDVLANLLRKRNPSTQFVTNLDDFFGRDVGGTLRIVEDGLWTATEMIGVLESILGLRRGTAKHEKTKPLSEPSKFRQREITLQFSIGSDYGIGLLTRFLRVQQLDNVQIIVPEKRRLCVLSDNGKKLFGSEFDFDEISAFGPPDGAVLPYIFHSPGCWGTQDRMRKAKRICEDLGAQLLTRYLERRVANHGWTMWAPAKVRKCGLGMWGLGLSFAFCHSVPKSTHPVFWSSGEINIDGKHVVWRPLFPNAED